MKKQTPDELEQIQQAILEREIEDELQKERLITFWKNYRFLIIGGVAAIILSVAGTEIYHSWLKKVRLTESNQFEQAVVLNATGEKDKAIEILNNLSNNAQTNYKHLADLKIAGINLMNNNKEEALKKLNTIINESKTPQALKNAAVLSYVGHQIDTEEPQKLLSLLNPLLNKSSDYFAPATELQVALLLKEGKKDEAKQVLEQASLNPLLSPAAVERFKSLLSAI